MFERRATFALAAGAATAALIRPAAAASEAGPLARAARPEDVGLSRDRLGHVTAWLRSEVEAGRIPGAVVAVGRAGKLVLHEPVGFRDREARAPMPVDAIFRIASMTKPFASLALMLLAEEGKVMLWHPVSRYLPEFKGQKVGLEGAPVERESTVQDLLRHTAGLTYGALPGPGPAPHPVQSAYVAAKVADRSQTSAEFIARLARPAADVPGPAPPGNTATPPTWSGGSSRWSPARTSTPSSAPASRRRSAWPIPASGRRPRPPTASPAPRWTR